MGTDSPQEVTQLRTVCSRHDESALEKSTPPVYAEPRRPARCPMHGERAGRTLQTTAPVHEACLKEQFDECLALSPRLEADRVAPDDSLTGPESMIKRKAKITGMRFCDGLSVEDIAETLQVSVDTVMRD